MEIKIKKNFIKNIYTTNYSQMATTQCNNLLILNGLNKLRMDTLTDLNLIITKTIKYKF